MFASIVGLYLIGDGVRSVVKFRDQSIIDHTPRLIRILLGLFILFSNFIPGIVVLWIMLDACLSYLFYKNQEPKEHMIRFLRFNSGFLLGI